MLSSALSDSPGVDGTLPVASNGHPHFLGSGLALVSRLGWPVRSYSYYELTVS
jgi:hypothetical protein